MIIVRYCRSALMLLLLLSAEKFSTSVHFLVLFDFKNFNFQYFLISKISHNHYLVVTTFLYCYIFWLSFKMLAALRLNKVSCFIMPLYKIYTMCSIVKRRKSVFLTQSKSNQTSDLQLLHCLITLHVYIVYIEQQNCIQALY